MKAEKSHDLQSPRQRPWKVQAQVKAWRDKDTFQSKSEDKRKPTSQLESNHAERERIRPYSTFLFYSVLQWIGLMSTHIGEGQSALFIDSNINFIQNHSLGHTRNNA